MIGLKYHVVWAVGRRGAIAENIFFLFITIFFMKSTPSAYTSHFLKVSRWREHWQNHIKDEKAI